MRVSENCFAVTGLGYSQPWYVNAGFVVGHHTTLVVDTGANSAAAATIHGYALAAKPDNTLRVINTEKHFDHIGGNSFFRERNIDVWGHVGIARTALEFAAEIDEFNESIPNPARRKFAEARAFFHGTSLSNPNRTIDSDLQWDLGGQVVHILLTPGHTATNVAVWVPAEQVLYAGDCLIHSYVPNLEAGGSNDWEQWLVSLSLIESLEPRALVCGHGPIATGDQISLILTEVRRVLRQSLEIGRPPTA